MILELAVLGWLLAAIQFVALMGVRSDYLRDMDRWRQERKELVQCWTKEVNELQQELWGSEGEEIGEGEG